MRNDKHPFDEHFRQRLTDHESPVPDDLFSRLQARRGAALPADAPLRERLAAHESPVSNTIFDAVLAERGRRKRRRVVLWRTFAGIAALWLLSTLLFDFYHKSNTGTTAADIQNPASDIKNTEGSKIDFNNKKHALNTPSNSELINKNSELNSNNNAESINKNKELNAPLNSSNNSIINNNSTINNRELKQQITIAEKQSFNKKSLAISNEKSTKYKPNNTNASVFNENTEGSNSNLINKNLELNTDKTSVNTPNTEGSNFNLINKNLELNTDKTSVNTPNTEGSNSNLINKNLELNINKSSVNTPNTEGSNFNLIDKNSELNTNKTSINTPNTEGSNSNLIDKNAELNTNKTSINTPNTEGFNTNLIDKNAELNTDKSSVNRLSNLNTTIDFLNLLTIKTLELSNKKRTNPCTDPENGCPTFNGRRRGMRRTTFYVDAFGAPEYVMRSFKTNLLESEKLLAARDSIEKTQYAVSTGARASLVFGNGLALRAGIVFNQINERAQFDSMGIGSIKTTYDVRIVNGKPDTVSITTVITDGIFHKTRYNRYRSIDIPLQVGYEIPLRNGWTFGFNGGANINIAAWQKADIVGADLRKQTVSSSINAPNPVFRTRLGVSFFGSVAAYRQLTNGLQLVIEPSVRYGLQPITRTDYALKQQYATAGVIIGLRLKL